MLPFDEQFTIVHLCHVQGEHEAVEPVFGAGPEGANSGLHGQTIRQGKC